MLQKEVLILWGQNMKLCFKCMKPQWGQGDLEKFKIETVQQYLLASSNQN